MAKIYFTIHDSLTFTIDTVKVTATITGMVNRTAAENSLSVIQKMVKKFINTEWTFSGIARATHSSGLEMVTCQAVARIPRKDAFALEERAAECKNPPYNISAIKMDNNPSTAMMEEKRKELRLNMYKLAVKQAQEYNAYYGEEYRLYKISYDMNQQDQSYINTRGVMPTISRTLFDHQPNQSKDDFQTTMRIEMWAKVTLKHEEWGIE